MSGKKFVYPEPLLIQSKSLSSRPAGGDFFLKEISPGGGEMNRSSSLSRIVFFRGEALSVPTTRGGRTMAVMIQNLLVKEANFSQVFSSPVFSEEDKAEGLRFLQSRIMKAAEQAAKKEALSVMMSNRRMKIKKSRRQKVFAGLVKDYLPKHTLRVAKKMTGLSSSELIRLTELAEQG